MLRRLRLFLTSIRGLTYRFPFLVVSRLKKPLTLTVDRVVSEHGRDVFFGYYDLSPFFFSDDEVVGLSVSRSNNQAEVVLWSNDERIIVGTTRAWNTQQGSRIRTGEWKGKKVVVYNDYSRESDAYVSRFKVWEDGCFEERSTELLPAYYDVNLTSGLALSLNFDRLHTFRPGYGYSCRPDTSKDNPAPKDDGVWQGSIGGQLSLVYSLKQLAEQYGKLGGDGYHYINHISINPGGNRYIFFHIEVDSQGNRSVNLFCCDVEAGSLTLVESGRELISHYCWIDDESIMLMIRTEGAWRSGLYDVSGYRLVRKVYPGIDYDGHPSVSPGRRWVLLDTPLSRVRTHELVLYDLVSGKYENFGGYYRPRVFSGPERCDLHGRVSDSGKVICVDNVRGGQRVIELLRIPESWQ